MSEARDRISLADWRRQISDCYAIVRGADAAGRRAAWNQWRSRRDRLFKSHPQTPLEADQLAEFTGLSLYGYDPGWRFEAAISRDVPTETFHVELAEDGRFSYTRIARAAFTVNGSPASLNLYWVEGYGGGLFLPFKDDTNRGETFGGGRYLYDTIKGVDLGLGQETINLDFNFAYNPSCAYHFRWVCPLSPSENTLPFAVAAGEKRF